MTEHVDPMTQVQYRKKANMLARLGHGLRLGPSFMALRGLAGHHQVFRNFATSPKQEPPYIVNMINSAFVNHPRETVISVLGMEILSIYGSYTLISMSGVHIPAEFALAFAMSRPFRRMRLPLELAGAAVLVRFFPSLRMVNVSALSGVFPESMRAQFREGTLKAGAEKFSHIMDQYGAGYFISARWVGVAIVLTIYGGLKSGVDFTSVLAQYGIEDFGTVLGSWAAAVVLSASFYPVTIVGGGALAHGLAWLSRRIL